MTQTKDIIPDRKKVMEYKGYPLLYGIGGQRFSITLTLITECEETLTQAEVKQWVNEQFDGCDVGQVIVGIVNENNSNFTIDHKKCTKGQIEDAFRNNGSILRSNPGYTENEIERAKTRPEGIVMYYSHNDQGTRAYWRDPKTEKYAFEKGDDQNG